MRRSSASRRSRSVLYRIEYWRATAALIADEPIFGVGPGNFQERYPRYKLPEASETIADPHNFLLEIWSTAGTPALLALLALMGTTVWQIARQRSRRVLESPQINAEPANATPNLAPYGIYSGAVLGLLLAGILGFVALDPLDTTRSGLLNESRDAALGVPIIWLTALPSYVFCFFLLRDWVEGGELPRAAVLCALIALLVNLLAAGAAIFAGVVNAAWVLWAISLQGDEVTETTAVAKEHGPISETQQQVLGWGTAVLFLAALIGCLYTEYWPIMNSHVLLSDAAQERRYESASEMFDRAVAADPWSPDVKRARAEFHVNVWQYGKTLQKYWTPFKKSMLAYEQSSPHHFTQHEQRGKWLLAAARRVRSPEHLAEAAAAYEAAVRCYPNSAYLHAQLAFLYAEQDRTADARREAEEAARLDALCPHVEQKLEKRKLYDPHWIIDKVGTIQKDAAPNAAAVVSKLRGRDASISTPPPDKQPANEKTDTPTETVP
jgi:tetratricopeptide (TPR) repeat protein